MYHPIDLIDKKVKTQDLFIYSPVTNEDWQGYFYFKYSLVVYLHTRLSIYTSIEATKKKKGTLLFFDYIHFCTWEVLVQWMLMVYKICSNNIDRIICKFDYMLNWLTHP